MLIRTATATDAEGVLELLLRLDEETRFMMYEPGERSTSVDRQAETLRALFASNNSTFLLAEEGGRPIGLLEATGGAFRRNRHVAHLVIGVLKEHAGYKSDREGRAYGPGEDRHKALHRRPTDNDLRLQPGHGPAELHAREEAGIARSYRQGECHRLGGKPRSQAVEIQAAQVSRSIS
jgi:hypothetical protein